MTYPIRSSLSGGHGRPTFAEIMVPSIKGLANPARSSIERYCPSFQSLRMHRNPGSVVLPNKHAADCCPDHALEPKRTVKLFVEQGLHVLHSLSCSGMAVCTTTYSPVSHLFFRKVHSTAPVSLEKRSSAHLLHVICPRLAEEVPLGHGVHAVCPVDEP